METGRIPCEEWQGIKGAVVKQSDLQRAGEALCDEILEDQQYIHYIEGNKWKRIRRKGWKRMAGR